MSKLKIFICILAMFIGFNVNPCCAANQSVIKGTIVALSENNLMVQADNQEITAVVWSDTTITTINGEKSNVSNLKTGMSVLIVGQNISTGYLATSIYATSPVVVASRTNQQENYIPPSSTVDYDSGNNSYDNGNYGYNPLIITYVPISYGNNFWTKMNHLHRHIGKHGHIIREVHWTNQEQFNYIKNIGFQNTHAIGRRK